MGLEDVGLIGGILFVIVCVSIPLRYAYDNPEIVKAIWRQSRMSGMLCVNIVRDYDDLQHPSQPQTAPDEETDGTDRRADGALSEHDDLWQEFCVDRTRARLVAVMIDSEIPVGVIRGLLKGDNTAISQEAAAAREQLGMAPAEEYRTPIGGRPTNPALYQDDPELRFSPPPR